jgi:hypothetical protein
MLEKLVKSLFLHQCWKSWWKSVFLHKEVDLGFEKLLWKPLFLPIEIPSQNP